VRRNLHLRLVQVAVYLGVAGERVGLFPVGEVVDVFGADDVDEFERGFTARQGLRLTLSWRLGLGGLRRRC
jgi:hypothetical protein